MNAVPSTWDSRVFRRKVGLLHLDEHLPASEIKQANGAFDVVFVKVPHWVDPGSEVVACDHVYDMEVDVPRSRASRSVKLVPVTRKHISIAQTAFKDSRFLRDPRLSSRAPSLYGAWLTGTQVYVLASRPKVAFILAGSDGDIRRIELIAVDEKERGFGAGRLLLQGLLRSPSRRVWRVRVAVRNSRAIRFYEEAGFRITGVSTAYHVWVT